MQASPRLISRKQAGRIRVQPGSADGIFRKSAIKRQDLLLFFARL
jgi:hypothetical protein